ncbi:MAG: response regulator transcription factor [Gemmatimonadota bacterium]|nr:response regulator transcription factor [Gemmatimonadota bacterium]MDH3478802.1 response regulator transcription factor [Gemmatimonadota bacterium]MDH3568873.1 response regulator transcription factor [Gemmatimonadota bacterium]MDH5548327.1 response regulator transcription factor [Gemmatimonadota bacterium]
MINVFIADDHAMIRDGLRRMLAATGDIRVTGEAASGDEVLEAVAATPVDVVVLDVAMPGKGFLEVLRELRERFPKIHTVVLSAHAEEEYAERALRAGAIGYVTKERTPEDLQEAIRRAHRGGRYVSDTLAQQLAAHLAGERPRPDHSALSDREYQVLQMLGRGKSVKEIAAALALSPKTVSTYRERVLEKLQLSTTADLIRYAVQQGIVE